MGLGPATTLVSVMATVRAVTPLVFGIGTKPAATARPARPNEVRSSATGER